MLSGPEGPSSEPAAPGRHLGALRLLVTAEAEPHRGEDLVGEVRLARADMNRSYSAVVRMGAGAPTSIAAMLVQRPSPESETRPSKPREVTAAQERFGGQVQQPRGDHAASPPDFGHRRDVDLGTGTAPGRAGA